MPGVLIGVAGALMIAAINLEVFRDLFQPARRGALSDWLGRTLFVTLRRGSRRVFSLAGPMALILVIGVWVAVLIAGFALLYYPAYPGGFATSSGARPPVTPRLLSTLYFSFETLITLGYGDLVPRSTFVRFASGTEALIGFAVLTASVSSIVLIYPALARMRLLARRASYLLAAERRCGVDPAGPSGEHVLAQLAHDVMRARIDLIHFPITYYFATEDPDACVARWTPALVEFARRGMTSDAPEARLAGATLDAALDDLAATIRERFLDTRGESRDEAFRAFARAHAVTAPAI